MGKGEDLGNSVPVLTWRRGASSRGAGNRCNMLKSCVLTLVERRPKFRKKKDLSEVPVRDVSMMEEMGK